MTPARALRRDLVHAAGCTHTDCCVYGFDSVEALKAWFEGWLPVLHDAGFRMEVYKAEPAHRSCRGTGQVSFAKPTKSVKSMPLVKL